MVSKKTIRVVVASDQAIYRRGIHSLLMSLENVQMVGEAHDGPEAIQLCDLVQPDILLLDLKSLPEQGVGLVSAIHQNWPAIKVVVLYSFYDENQWQDQLEDAIVYQFCKDISEEEFAAAIFDISLSSSPPARDLHPVLQEHAIPVHMHKSDMDRDVRDQELVKAGRIQADILPEKPPHIPGWEISAMLESARETSGDFYDFIPFTTQHWGIVMADVTDKGIGAALFMALSSTLIRTYAARYPTLPALTMDIVNERILSDTRGGMFVTAFYGVLEPSLGRFRFVNAGHPPGLLFSRQKAKLVDQLRPTGPALGLLEKTHWRQKIVRLAPGDILLLYTDGITEAQNQHGHFFGEQRLLDVARSLVGRTAYDIQEGIMGEVHAFTGETNRQDDIALVVIRRK